MYTCKKGIYSNRSKYKSRIYIFTLCTFYFIYIYLKDFIYLFLERGREKKERNISVWLPLARPLLETWSATQACALIGNWTSDSLACRLTLNRWATPARAICIFISILHIPLQTFVSIRSLSLLGGPKTRTRAVQLVCLQCHPWGQEWELEEVSKEDWNSDEGVNGETEARRSPGVPRFREASHSCLCQVEWWSDFLQRWVLP